MSSGFKKQLLQSQAYSGTTKKGDVVVLPPDSEDVILVTKCSGKDSGVVKASLEHSPDKEDANFSIVQSEKVSTSAATTGWGNLKYIDTTATGTGSDYKNKTVKANNLSGQSNDIFHSKMTKDDPWSISTWIKSSNAPATTSNTYYQSTKSWTATIRGGYYNRAKLFGSDTAANFTNWDIGFDNPNGYTISWWLKCDSNAYGYIAGGNNGWSQFQRYLLHSSGTFKHYWESSNSHIVNIEFDMSSYMDGSWRQVTFTFLGWSTFDGAGGGTAGTEAAYKLYVDNTEVSPDTSATAVSGTPASTSVGWTGMWGVGGEGNNGTNASTWIGSMDDVTMWNKALSTSERTELYNGGYVVDVSQLSFYSTSDCALWLKMGDGADDTLNVAENAHSATNRMQDYSGNSNHFYPFIDTSNALYNTASYDSSNYAPGKPSTYTDSYLPVLFSTGSSATVPGALGNTKHISGNTSSPPAQRTAHPQTVGVLGDNSQTAIIGSDKSWTINFWVGGNSNNTTGSGTFFGTNNGTASEWLYFSTDTSGRVKISTNSGSKLSNNYQGPHVDTDWHMVTITFYAPSSGVTPGTTAWAILESTDAEDTHGIRVFVDGQCIDWATSHLTTLTSGIATNTEKLCWGGGYGYYVDPFSGSMDEMSIHDEYTSIADVASKFYDGTAGAAGGKPKDLTGDSSCKVWLRYDSLSAGNIAYGTTIPNVAYTAGGTDPYPTTINTVWSQSVYQVSHYDIVEFGTSDSMYTAPATAYDVFGNGMRMSFTKKLKTDATWDTAGAQTSRFLLSFDGFEDTAAYFLGYNTTFTRPLHPKTGAEDASADLLDGEWHNIIVSYRGGAPGTAVNPHDYIAVCFDGKQITTTDCVEKTSTVTFINDHFRYTDVSEDLRGTFFLSAGDPFVGASANSKYAFQGGLDETSLHDDSWQLSSSPSTGWSSGGFNTMKPNTIYGIDNTRNGANDAGSPYDLKNPSTIGHPGPTGNSYLEPSASAVGGGLQVYYRWGDTTGDCSTSIHDVQSAIDGVTDRDLAVLYSSISAGDATDENSAAWDTAVDTVAEGGIEVASTSIAGSAGFALENAQITCADGLQFFRVNAPKLSNLRIKWTGAGTATSVEASIHYRRRKK